jgi:pimeloyl-ACP methyl ester carboxylesterase
MVNLSPALSAWQRSGRFFDHRGHRIFFKQAGRGPALLLIHGYPTGSYDWHAIWPALAERFTVIAPDMLGLGFSDKPAAAAYCLQGHAEMHDALIALLGLRSVHVMAHDVGVSVAQAMLVRREEVAGLPHIASMLFLNGGLCPEAYRPRLVLRLLASPLGGAIGPRISRAAFARSVTALFGPHTHPEPALLDDFWSLVNHNDGRRVTHLVSRFWRERLALRDRLLAPLLRGAVPLRLVNGAADPNSGRHMAERFRALRPDADIVSLEGIGHWPQLEAAAAVVRAALEFFDAQRQLTWKSYKR